MKLVLVDDDPDTNELFEVVGRMESVETKCFTSSLVALEYLDSHAADVVILDLKLPVIDGLRLAKEIRKNEERKSDKPRVKMVFYTGEEIDETIERVGEKVGVEKRYMIHKPYSPNDLIQTLKEDFGEV